jgi:phosphatidylinositol alpha-1,6-mannosyltransferase
VILTTGNLVARKGHDMVLRALARLDTEIANVTYLVVGDGPARSDLESLATALGVRDRVVFAGRALDADLPALYALADVFVMASRERRDENDVEGFGIVYLEAAACGKPVIGGRSGGIPEAVVDGVTGLLVDPSDPDDIAKTLASVLADSELAARLGLQGHARVVRDFTWARAADRMHDVLTAAAAGGDH